MPEQAAAPAPAAPSSPIASLKAFFSAEAAGHAEAPEVETTESPETEDTPTSGVAHTDSPAEDEAAGEDETQPKSKKPATPKEDAGDEETETDEGSDEDDVAAVVAQLSSLKDLAEATGVDVERLLDLQLPTKIDGKEGTARLRDLQRSYQLEAHINQKLATIDNDRKALEAKRAQSDQAAAERIQSLEMGLAILDRALQGELASVKWQELQDTNPIEFNSKYVAYQHRFGQMQQIAQQLAAERQKQQSSFQASQKAWLDEQGKLLKIKVPEWSDDVRRTQDRAAVSEYLKGYGITAQEFDQVQDHRYLAVLRDGWKWAELQKQKPATLKKLKVAPKILRAGSKQSKDSVDKLASKGDVERLQRSGKVRDATAVLKRILK
jgi:hypothetical protein